MTDARSSSAYLQARHASATPGDILQMRQALGRFPEAALSLPPNGQVVPLLAAQPTQVSPKLLMQPALSLVDWTNMPEPLAEPPAPDQQASLLPFLDMHNADAFHFWVCERLQCLQLQLQVRTKRPSLMASEAHMYIAGCSSSSKTAPATKPEARRCWELVEQRCGD